MRKLKIKNKKVLLKITFRLRNKEEFSKIEAIIKEKEYIVEEFGEIDKNNFNFRDIEKRVNDVRKKYGINCKIALLSNIKDVLFASFRIHKEIIDEFIFFIDKINYNILNKNEYNSEKILELVDIEKENINKKIYINIEFENFMHYFDFFLTNNNFKNFENVEKIEETVEKNNKNIEDFKELNGTELFNLLYKNKYFIVFYIVGLIRKSGIEEARKYLIPLFKYLQNMEITIKQEIAETIYSTKGIAFLEFKEKMGIFSLLVLLELPFNYILKFIMKTLLEDDKYIKYYPPIISDIFYYVNKNGIAVYKEFENEFKEIVKRIEEYYLLKNDILKKSIYNENSKKIAFIVDSMVNVNYSVEKLTFDMVRNLKKQYPEYYITIFVENNFNYTDEERVMLHSFIGDNKTSSEVFHESHKKEIQDLGIEIYYSLPIIDKEFRVKDMASTIFEYNPEVILTTTLCSYLTNLLYVYYPVIHLSMADYNPVNSFDIQLHPHIEEIKKHFIARGKKMDDNIYAFEYGGDFQKKNNTIYKREDFKLKETDFIMISVGVRLRNEMKEEFIDAVVSILNKYNNVKWYLVGETEFPIINKKYLELINNKIFMLKFEENLSSFYGMCNLYINPFREGGGFSISQAIANELPVISEINSTAGKYYVGESQCLNGKDDYLKAIEEAIKDDKYREKILQAEKEYIKKFDYKNIINELMKYIEMAKKKFLQRQNNKQ